MEGVIREDELHGKNNINPFEGHSTKGMAVATVVRGMVQMRDGELTGESGTGRLISPLVPVAAG
jgi:dihydroorotase-like cyclic amidohydrolase